MIINSLCRPAVAALFLLCCFGTWTGASVLQATLSSAFSSASFFDSQPGGSG